MGQDEDPDATIRDDDDPLWDRALGRAYSDFGDEKHSSEDEVY